MKAVLPILAIVGGCASEESRGHNPSSPAAGATTVCEVMAQPDAYVGRQVTVRGLYAQGPHGRLLHDRSCPEWDFKVSLSLRADGDPAAERLVRRAFREKPAESIPVIISGTLSARAVITGCTRPSCREYSLQDARILAAPR